VKSEEKPIIVCGPPRSGTTAVQLMLRVHPDISIAREVPLYNMPSLKPLLEETARQQSDEWTEERRFEVVRALWFATSRPVPDVKVPRRWGMKTTWSELDADFWESLVDPVYIYAMRRGDRVIQSNLRLGWIPGPPSEFVDRYKQSIRAFERLREKGSAHLVQLDLANSPEDRYRVTRGVFDFLDEELEERQLRYIANFKERINQPTSQPGEEPQLPDNWRELLAADGEYQELMARYGY